MQQRANLLGCTVEGRIFHWWVLILIQSDILDNPNACGILFNDVDCFDVLLRVQYAKKT